MPAIESESEFTIALSEEDGERLAARIVDPARTQPIVGLSTRAGEDATAFDPQDVRRALGPDAIVVGVRTGPATRYLAELLPEHFGVFGGAARIWWPGITPEADPRRHPLVLDKQGRYGTRALEILVEGFREGPPPKGARLPTRVPRAAEPARLATLAIPDAVARDRTRAHHLMIVAAWLARDHDLGRRERPIGPLAIGADYLRTLAAAAARIDEPRMAVLAARIASLLRR